MHCCDESDLQYIYSGFLMSYNKVFTHPLLHTFSAPQIGNLLMRHMVTCDALLVYLIYKGRGPFFVRNVL